MKQTFIKSAMLLLLILSTATTRAQEVALKTNLLGWASTSANAGIEIGTGKKTTFQLFGTLNPWKFSGDKKMRFWNVMPEYRWYTCQKFGGHFFGIHALGGEYNIKNIIRKTKCFRILERNAKISKTKRNFSRLYPTPQKFKKIDRLRRNEIHLKAVRMMF